MRIDRRSWWLAALVTPAVTWAGDLLPCAYVARGPGAEWSVHAGCAAVTGRVIRIQPRHLRQLRFTGRERLAALSVGPQHFYVKPDGSTLPVVTFDNGADLFAEGLVRSVVAGKMAYHDARFRQAIAPRYDWGWPFEHGRARVCQGCRPGAPDADGHVPMVGGRWGTIDRQGRLTAPLAAASSEARPPGHP